jgi:hypothetical protein
VRGGGIPNADDWRKSLALCLLCGSPVHVSYRLWFWFEISQNWFPMTPAPTSKTRLVWFGWLVWFGLAGSTHYRMQILRVDSLPQHLVPIGNFNLPTADVINLSFGPFNGSEQESLEDSR